MLWERGVDKNKNTDIEASCWLLKQQQNTEFITEILEKVIKAPTKKKCRFKKEREKCER